MAGAGRILAAKPLPSPHYSDVIMSAMASQIPGVSIDCSIVYSDADQRKHQSSSSLVFVKEKPPVICGFPSQRDTSNAENVSIWWRHHEWRPFVNWTLENKRREIFINTPCFSLKKSHATCFILSLTGLCHYGVINGYSKPRLHLYHANLPVIYIVGRKQFSP